MSKEKELDEGITSQQGASIRGRKEEESETGITCDDCGEPTAMETTCPYAEEIDDQLIECLLCNNCYHERCMDI